MNQPLGDKVQGSVLDAIVRALDEASPELIEEMEESRRVLGTIKPEEWQLRFTI